MGWHTSVCMYWNPESALTTELLDGYLSNLVGIKYSWPPPPAYLYWLLDQICQGADPGYQNKPSFKFDGFQNLLCIQENKTVGKNFQFYWYQVFFISFRNNQRKVNDFACIVPQSFDNYFNLHILIKFCIHWVKETSNFVVSGLDMYNKSSSTRLLCISRYFFIWLNIILHFFLYDAVPPWYTTSVTRQV